MSSLFSQHRLAMLLSCFLLSTLNSCYFPPCHSETEIVPEECCLDPDVDFFESGASGSFSVNLLVALTENGEPEPFQYSASEVAEILEAFFFEAVDAGFADERVVGYVDNITVLMMSDLAEFHFICGTSCEDERQRGVALACVCFGVCSRALKNGGPDGTIILRPGTGMLPGEGRGIRGAGSALERTFRHELFHLILWHMRVFGPENEEHQHDGWRELNIR